MRMSTEGRANLHQREKLIMKFYDDGGRPGVGNCSYGFGRLVHVNTALSQQQFDALVSLTYNAGAYGSRDIHSKETR